MIFRIILAGMLVQLLPLGHAHKFDAGHVERRSLSQQFLRKGTHLDDYNLQMPKARQFDEFAEAKLAETFSRRPSPSRTRTPQEPCKGCDVKARLDNFAIQLQNEPNAQGYLATMTPRRAGTLSQKQQEEMQTSAYRVKDYLVNTRGIDAGRLVTIVGFEWKEHTVQLWIVPAGAVAPTP